MYRDGVNPRSVFKLQQEIAVTDRENYTNTPVSFDCVVRENLKEDDVLEG